MLEEFFDGQADVAGNLTKEDGRDVSTRMAGDGGSPSVRMAELLMTPLLARLDKTETFEDGHDFEWLQYGTKPHLHATTTLWVPINSVSSSGSPSSKSNSTTSLRLLFNSSKVSP